MLLIIYCFLFIDGSFSLELYKILYANKRALQHRLLIQHIIPYKILQPILYSPVHVFYMSSPISAPWLRLLKGHHIIKETKYYYYKL